jgi:uncharacterized protein (TIGR03067 family)
VRAFVNLAVLASFLSLSACTKSDPTERTQGAKQSAQDKPAAEASAAPTDKSKSSHELDGSWRLVVVEFGPNTAGEEALKGTTFIIKDGKYTINGRHINCEGEFEIDWTMKPPTITISEAQAIEVGTPIKYGEKIKYHGIVRVEGDKLEMRFTTLDKARPTTFAQPNEGTTYYSARRVKE